MCQRCCGSDFNRFWAGLLCCISKGLQKRNFLHVYLTTVSGIRNFRNTSAMRVIVVWKCSKFYLDFRNAKKKLRKGFFFGDDCIWSGCIKLSLLKREYFWTIVNVLKNSPKILPITKRDFFVKVVSFRFQHYLIPFPICLSKGPLKRDFLDIYLTTFFGIRNFGNRSVMRVIFFFKVAKFYLHFKNAEKYSHKAFCFLDNCIWIGCVKLSLLRREY